MKYVIADLQIDARNSERNEEIIRNWNAKVTAEDVIYIAGNISHLTSHSDVLKVLNQLNGKLIFVTNRKEDDEEDLIKYLTLNNHLVEGNLKFDFEEHLILVKEDNQKYLITHSPQKFIPKSFSFCGKAYEEEPLDGYQLDVGINSSTLAEYPYGTPILLSEAMTLLQQ